MFQQVIIILLFAGALYFVGRMLYNAFKDKTGCSGGCAKCHAIDFDKIEKQLKEKGV